MRFPKISEFSNGAEPLKINAFETNLPQFSHLVSELAGKIYFDRFSLQSTNSRIGVRVRFSLCVVGRN